MKKNRFMLVLSLSAILMSCAGSGDNNGGSDDNAIEGCSKESVEDFDSFLGITYETNELEMDDILGEFTGGRYTNDSAAFIYDYKRVENAPVSVWVNGRSGNVETVFMEVLGYDDYFKSDLDDAIKEFDLQECDSKWFGMKSSEVTKILGKPAKDESSLDNSGQKVQSLVYESEDKKIIVNFKFYAAQGDMCSSVMVDWFY